jgi:hypothetical protein
MKFVDLHGTFYFSVSIYIATIVYEEEMHISRDKSHCIAPSRMASDGQQLISV